MAEDDWCRLIERLRLTHLFTNWEREGGREDGKLNEAALAQVKNMLREFDEERGGSMEFEEFCKMMLF